ncbi:class II fructose-bisphosphate aldolase [Streptantibioticus cattleyicolor]|uniref:Ketose-bisphosphate aldolase n=1 Tax=Streptantibioticus cattleyicolor (strain ATCC 35852 / DSM 46488 / JCM 4925 / NBRC 14057 / NRRL 8057) TaxID=1003195 RepID=F8JLT3_STREN|nr:class II fructose-bisphosphate aldolase [Streptantibioticus cattleyicolor]AEW99483.1 ketose-bisphosphate aldolase [Streptantibioticus cattleyicolor NRRL 8057 = DSM 46488]CCB71476.1 Fructose-bisphosphate aldolase [Streptantibioticus cattleyicolor NRRL 8057 = DSM 46488]
MPLIPTATIVSAAVRDGHGAGAFNVALLEQAEAVLAGAARAGSAVIVQISENAVRYHGALAPLAEAVLAAAEAGPAPAALHLDHATDTELVKEAVALGFSSVMYDGSRLPWRENMETTREITAWCQERGVWVEAELGEIGGKDGAHAPGVRTDPDEAPRFVSGTGVDALAVAVGSSHAMTSRDAVLDLELIATLGSVVPVPLVLHGSSGVPDAMIADAVRNGMTKVNLSTHLNRVFSAAVRAALADAPAMVDPRRYLAPARAAMDEEVARILGVLGAAGSADALLRREGRVSCPSGHHTSTRGPHHGTITGEAARRRSGALD